MIKTWQQARDRTLATQRFAELVRQIKAELGADAGWLSEAARRLGVAHSYVRSVDQGLAGTIRLVTVTRVMTTLGLRAEFFFDPEADASDYRRFLVDLDAHGMPYDRDARQGFNSANLAVPASVIGDLMSQALRTFQLAQSSDADAAVDSANELVTVLLDAVDWPLRAMKKFQERPNRRNASEFAFSIMAALEATNADNDT